MNNYTLKQLLEEFRRRRFLEPLRDDCVVERMDGPDIDTQLKEDILQWYARLIDTAPPDWLHTEDVSADTIMEIIPGTGAVTLSLPEDVRRVISITIEGNPLPVALITDPESPLMKLQTNPFTRAGRMNPVAFLNSPRFITLFAHDRSGTPPVLTSLTAVRLEPDIFKFDNRAWETVPQIKI
ncbi:MAG: hypothetical protein K2M07_05225 [Muribaculaceae bacterium]|nr:hypothetical protein [Muribaculaceae bacterium]